MEMEGYAWLQGRPRDGAVGFKLPIPFQSFPGNSSMSGLTLICEDRSCLHRINVWVNETWVSCQVSGETMHMKQGFL